MGYTHYWYTPLKMDPSLFAAFSADAQALAYACEIPIAEDYDIHRPPIFSTDKVWFNGIGEDGHETFGITRTTNRPADRDGLAFDFCKTAAKPYDTLVTAVLMALKYRFGMAVVIASDGDFERDWADGRQLYERVFPGRPQHSPLREDEEE